MRTLAHGLPSRPLGAHLAVADVLSGGCCWSISTRPIVVEVYTSVSAGRTVPGARRVRICVLFNVIVPYTHRTSLHQDQPPHHVHQSAARMRHGRAAPGAPWRLGWFRSPRRARGPTTGRAPAIAHTRALP